MGAETFINVAKGKSVNAAFIAAVDSAAYYNGHGGYTGTIAEKETFVCCSEKVFPSLNEAKAYANKLIDDGDDRIDDKWGPAGYVQFLNGKDIEYLFFGWASS